jgi:hypothetical protein
LERLYRKAEEADAEQPLHHRNFWGTNVSSFLSTFLTRSRASKQASKEGRKEASKQASKQSINQASKQASKQASNLLALLACNPRPPAAHRRAPVATEVNQRMNV